MAQRPPNLNGRATDYVNMTLEEEYGPESPSDDQDPPSKKSKRDMRVTLPFSRVEEILADLDMKALPSSSLQTRPDCFGCTVALFAHPDDHDTKILRFMDKLINLVSLRYIYLSIHKSFEKQRKEEADEHNGVYQREEWTLEMIKEHFEEHVVDHRIQDRLRTDSLLLSERLLKNNYLYENPDTHKLDVDEKLYKLWLETMQTIKKLNILPNQSIFTGGSVTATDGLEPQGTSGGVSKKRLQRPL